MGRLTTPTITDARARLSVLLRERALIRESVVLSSGRRSSYYFDARQVLLDPEGAHLAGLLAWDALAPSAPGAVGGLTLGADPLVCATSLSAWTAGERVTGFFVRKEAKKHGLQRWPRARPSTGSASRSSRTSSPPEGPSATPHRHSGRAVRWWRS